MRIQVSELQKHNSLIWYGQGDVDVPSHSNIFLGGGIATTETISSAIPFDLLGFILTAEQTKRISRGRVHMLIADQHAWLANNLSKTEAVVAAKNLLAVVRKIITTCELKNWHVHTASDLFSQALPSSYEILESRDVDFFATKFACNLKVGWTFSPKETGITDESHFDTLHAMSTLLIKPGVTSSDKKPHESPYICTDPSSRIVISPSENVEAKLRSFGGRINAVKNHLRDIGILFEQLINPFPPKTPVEQKVSAIINKITEGV